MKKKRRKRKTMAQLIQQGDIRVGRLIEPLWAKYSGVPNVIVTPHFGYGTGTDIIVHQNILRGNRYFFKALELREVTNFSKYTSQGKPEAISKLKRQQDLITSLTRKYHKILIGYGQKRVYSTQGTRLFLDVSYITNVPPQFQSQLNQNGIKIMVWNRTETPKGYKIETSPTKRRYYRGIQIPHHVLGKRGH